MDIIDCIKKAGIVGLGGAGFPTSVKLNCNPKTLIVNGAECEPLLKNDRFVMLNFAEKLVRAIDSLSQYYGGIRCVFALKEGYREEIKSLESAIIAAKSRAEVFLLKGYYPAGDEQLIVYEVTGTPVPPSGLPLDCGCVVINANTLYSIDNALSGLPFTRKFVTICGEVNAPGVYKVPVGTSLSDCIRFAGGATVDNYIVVSGGPMMGKYVKAEDIGSEFVKKTTSGYIVLPVDCRIDNLNKTPIAHIANRAKSCCIQCRICTDMCPRHLVGNPIRPHLIMRRLAYSFDIESMLDDDTVKTALLCSECGVCEVYACPMGLQPRTVNSLIKKEYAKRKIRYEKGKGQLAVNEYREERLIPASRMAARVGVSAYYDSVSAEKATECTAKKVTLFLSQGIGAPSVPVVVDAQEVKMGDVIANPPENGLGSILHATISGKVAVKSDRIIIE